MANWEIEEAQDKAVNTYRERLIWMYSHESMMWEFYIKVADSLPAGDKNRYAREDARIRGEAHFRQGQGLMDAWKELNELHSDLHKWQVTDTH